MIRIALALLVSAAPFENASDKWVPPGGRPYEVTVADLLQCYLADGGDLLWSLSDYRRIVARHMDTRRPIVVYRMRGVRQVCWLEAVRSLRKAGFSDIREAPTKSR